MAQHNNTEWSVNLQKQLIRRICYASVCMKLTIMINKYSHRESD